MVDDFDKHPCPICGKITKWTTFCSNECFIKDQNRRQKE